MKYFFAFFLVFLSLNVTFAQSSIKLYEGIPMGQELLYQHKQMLSGMLSPYHTDTKTMKTTASATHERVIAQSTFDADSSAITDSVNLKYSTTRTSTYDYNMMFYAYNYPYNTTPMFQYNGFFTKPQVLFDTFSHWTIDPVSLAYGFFEQTSSVYDTNNNLTNFYDLYADSAFFQNMSFVNNFNTANTITAGYWFNLSAGVADSTEKQFFTYNTSGQITEDSTYLDVSGSWYIVSKSYYSYSSSGDLTQIDCYANLTDTTFTKPLQEQLQYINTYDASHRLLTVLTSFSDSTALIPYIQDTFTYSGSLTYYNSWVEYELDTIHKYWTPYTYVTKHINSSSLPDTVYNEVWDSSANAWEPASKEAVLYNSYNDPHKLLTYSWSGTSYTSSPAFLTTYYYQSYLDSGICAPALSDSVTNALCNGAPDASIILTVTGGADTATYLWSGPGGFSATTQNLYSVKAGTYTVIATVVSFGCSDTLTANIMEPPPIILTSSFTPTTICTDDTLNFMAAATGGTGTISYLWKGPSSFFSILPNPSIYPATVANSGSYIVYAADSNGCLDSAITLITVHDTPIVSLGADTAICTGISLVLNAGNPGDSYVWNTGVYTQTTDVNVTGVYSVVVTSSFGCVGSGSIQVTVDTLPGADSILITEIAGNTFNFSAVNPVFVTSYLWTFGDGSVSKTASPTHTYSDTGTFSVFLILTNSCGATKFIHTYIKVTTLSTNLASVSSRQNILIYPNPATNEITLQSNTNQTSTISIKLNNVTGQVVFMKNINLQNGLAHISLNTLMPGVYYITVEDENGIILQEQSIIKQGK